jgi:hypothetical protein
MQGREGKASITVAGKVLRGGEISVRIIGPDRATVLAALNQLREVYSDVIITALRPCEFEDGWRGYAYARVGRGYLSGRGGAEA